MNRLKIITRWLLTNTNKKSICDNFEYNEMSW